MRSIAQLTAGARRAPQPRPPEGRAHPDERPEESPKPRGGGDRPVLPADGSREALMRLVETIARPLGLTDTELRALRAIVTACRWADFVDPSRDPVCFRQQQRMAEALGVTPGHFRRIEAKLERLGLIERATCENGHRGRLGPRGSDGAGGPVAGLSLAPLLANVPRWEAMAKAAAREAAALAEGRAMIRIERRAARHAALALAPGHPARAAYEALRGAAFPRSAGYMAQAAITAHLEALRGVIEEARAAAPKAQADEPIMAGLGGQDDALMHGAPCAQERRHTEDTTDPQTGSCNEAAGEERGASVKPERPTDRGGSGPKRMGRRPAGRETPTGGGRRRAGRAPACLPPCWPASRPRCCASWGPRNCDSTSIISNRVPRANPPPCVTSSARR